MNKARVFIALVVATYSALPAFAGTETESFFAFCDEQTDQNAALIQRAKEAQALANAAANFPAIRIADVKKPNFPPPMPPLSASQRLLAPPAAAVAAIPPPAAMPTAAPAAATPPAPQLSCGDNLVCRAFERANKAKSIYDCRAPGSPLKQYKNNTEEMVCDGVFAAKQKQCDWASGNPLAFAVCTAYAPAQKQQCNLLSGSAKAACECMAHPWEYDDWHPHPEVDQFCTSFQEYDRSKAQIEENISPQTYALRRMSQAVEKSEASHHESMSLLASGQLSYRGHVCNGKTLMECLERLEDRCKNPKGINREQTRDNQSMCSLIQETKKDRRDLSTLLDIMNDSSKSLLKRVQSATNADAQTHLVEQMRAQRHHFGPGSNLETDAVYLSKLEKMKNIFQRISQNQGGSALLDLYKNRVHKHRKLEVLLDSPAQQIEARKNMAYAVHQEFDLRRLSGQGASVATRDQLHSYQSAVHQNAALYQLSSEILDLRRELAKRSFNPFRKKKLKALISQKEEEMKAKRTALHPIWSDAHKYIPKLQNSQ